MQLLQREKLCIQCSCSKQLHKFKTNSAFGNIDVQNLDLHSLSNLESVIGDIFLQHDRSNQRKFLKTRTSSFPPDRPILLVWINPLWVWVSILRGKVSHIENTFPTPTSTKAPKCVTLDTLQLVLGMLFNQEHYGISLKIPTSDHSPSSKWFDVIIIIIIVIDNSLIFNTCQWGFHQASHLPTWSSHSWTEAQKIQP